jgi:hypothetical protein
MGEYDKKLDEIIKLMKEQLNLLSSLHNLFNQLNKEYLIETQKEGHLINDDKA